MRVYAMFSKTVQIAAYFFALARVRRWFDLTIKDSLLSIVYQLATFTIDLYFYSYKYAYFKVG